MSTPDADDDLEPEATAPELPPESPLPKLLVVPAALIAASSALPLLPDGRNFLALVAEAFGRGPLDGLLMIFGFGSPYVFALLLAVGVAALPVGLTRRLVRTPVAMMHSQLLLVSIVIVTAGTAVAGIALLGFAIVSGGYLALHTARTSATGDGPMLGWYARWGAMVIAAVCGWTLLQRTEGIEFQYGLYVMLGGAVAIALILGRTPFSGAAPRSPAP